MPEARDPRDSSLFVNSLEKAFRVLRAFSRQHGAMTFTEIAQRTGLERSAAQRFVFTLHVMGYLIRDERTKIYRLSPKLMEFAATYLYSDPLVTISQPLLVQAREKTGETVNLSVLDGADIIIVSRIPARDVISLEVQVGSRLPALYTASGRAMAAHLDDDGFDAVLAATRMEQHTASSLTSFDALRQEVGRAREMGFCVAKSQLFQGDISIAAPVLSSGGMPIAALSLSVSDERFDADQAAHAFGGTLVDIGKQISAALRSVPM